MLHQNGSDEILIVVSQNREYAALYERYCDMNKDEVMLFGGQFLSGIFFTTLAVEGNLHQPWLLNR